MAGRSDEVVEEVRARADLVEIVSEHLQLRARGRNLVGLCPFHEEKTPSFSLNPETQLWYCFGCHQGGDVFAFVQRIDGLSFREALERLAERYQVALPTSPQEARRASEQDRLRQVLQWAQRFFREHLQGSRGGDARQYLQRRQVTEASSEAFGIGYAPAEWEALLRFLRRKGVTEEEALGVGVVVRGASGDVYDRFRDRLMFPIHDARGRLIGFGGRALREEQEPKYLNTPETPLFSKGEVLYGFHLAQKSIRAEGSALLMEGYLDVVMAHQHGLSHAIAVLGTAMTAAHLRFLRRHASSVYLCFDADSAGLRAMVRTAPLFEEAEMEARVVPLPAGQDPDSLLRTEGVEALKARIQKAPLLVEYRILQVMRQPGDRVHLAKQIIPLLAQVRDPLRRDALLRRTARWWVHPHVERDRVAEETLRQEVQRYLRQGGAGSSAQDSLPRVEAHLQDSSLVRHERRLLALMLRSPALLEQYADQLTADLFSDRTLGEIAQALRSQGNFRQGLLAPPAGLSTAGAQVFASLVAEEVALESLRPADIERGLDILRHRRRFDEVRRCLQGIDGNHPSEEGLALLQEFQQLKRVLGPYGLA